MSLNILRRVDYAPGLEGIVNAELVNTVAFNVANAVEYPWLDGVDIEFQLKTAFDVLINYNQFVVSGTSNDIILTNASGNSTYQDGMIVKFVALFTNTSSIVTVKVNNGNTIPVNLPDGNMIAGAIRKDNEVVMVYRTSVNGFVLLNGVSISAMYGNSTENISISSNTLSFFSDGIGTFNVTYDSTTGRLKVTSYDATGTLISTPLQITPDGEVIAGIGARDQNGLVTLSQLETADKRPVFLAAIDPNNVQTFVAQVSTKLAMDTIIEDSHGGFDITTYEYKAPMDGYYHLFGNLRVTGNADTSRARIELDIYINGTPYIATGFKEQDGANQWGIHISVGAIKLLKNDIVGLYFRHNMNTGDMTRGGSLSNTGSMVNYFGGHYIGALNV